MDKIKRKLHVPVVIVRIHEIRSIAISPTEHEGMLSNLHTLITCDSSSYVSQDEKARYLFWYGKQLALSYS